MALIAEHFGSFLAMQKLGFFTFWQMLASPNYYLVRMLDCLTNILMKVFFLKKSVSFIDNIFKQYMFICTTEGTGFYPEY